MYVYFSQVLRFPASYPRAELRRRVLTELHGFFREQEAEQVNVSITGNYVLEGTVNGERTLSLFYGQSFANERQDNALQYVVNDLADAARVLPFHLTSEEMIEHFERLRTNVSGTTVTQIVSKVFIFRTVKTGRSRQSQSRAGSP